MEYLSYFPDQKGTCVEVAVTSMPLGRLYLVCPEMTFISLTS